MGGSPEGRGGGGGAARGAAAGAATAITAGFRRGGLAKPGLDRDRGYDARRSRPGPTELLLLLLLLLIACKRK